jgi:hypothetical protein
LKKAVEKDRATTRRSPAREPAARKRGNVEEGKALLDKVPPESVKDSAVYLNAGSCF